MASVSWNPFGVALTITANSTSVTRTSATQFKVTMTVSWSCGSSNKTDYGMTAASGGSTVTLNTQGTKASSGSGTLTGTYSISGNGAATKTVTVTFRNFNEWHDDSATKNLSLSVSVPAWTSYTVSYNANGGKDAPDNQTKWKDITLPLSSTKPTRTGYTFNSWNTASGGTGTKYNPGGNYTANADATLYAQWTPITYTVTYDANGGSGAPSNQTKTYGVTLTLSSTKPTRTGYNFIGWGTSKSATTATYSAGGSYTNNASITLYAIWATSYKKPTITNLSVNRCNSSGTTKDDGKYASVSFTWNTFNTVSKITIAWHSETDSSTTAKGSTTASASGTAGTVTKTIGGNFNTEYSYIIDVTVTDSGGSASKSIMLLGSEHAIDFKKQTATDGVHYGVAIGQAAQTLKLFDVKYPSRFRDTVCIGNKTGYQDGKDGILLNKDGIIHLQRGDASGFEPYIGFFGNGDTTNYAWVKYGTTTNMLELQGPKGCRLDHNTIIGIDKTSYNDGKTGWYLGADGTAHVSNSGTTGIYFHKANSTSNTAYVKEDTSGTLTVGPNLESGAITATGAVSGKSASITDGVSAATVTANSYVSTANVRGVGNYGLTFGVANKPEIMHIYQTGGSTTGNRWFRPMTNDDLYLGTEGQRWKQIWSVNSLNSTSDRNVKCDITTFDERYEKLFASLKPVAYKFINGDSGRFHSGFISQDVEEAIEEAGLTALDFAAFCKDKKTQEIEDPETGEITFIDICDADGNPEYSYSLRYEEFIALNTHMIQKLQNENSELKERVELLEERLKKLEELINK